MYFTFSKYMNTPLIAALLLNLKRTVFDTKAGLGHKRWPGYLYGFLDRRSRLRRAKKREAGCIFRD
jgi:hypothetical protein